MAWPSLADYQDAIQNPSLCFRDSELRSGRPVLDMLGLPRPMTGNFASVYEFICPVKSEKEAGDKDRKSDKEKKEERKTRKVKKYAVRCFLYNFPDQQKRYNAISMYLKKMVREKLPFLVDFEYQPEGILVHGEWYPVVKLEWIEGVHLSQFIEQCIFRGELGVLDNLAEEWVSLLRGLKKAGVSHGDLSHSNVLVSGVQIPAGAGKKEGISFEKLMLIDYDGMFVPPLEGLLSNETGHPAYQHPARTNLDFGQYIDNFAGLVIYVSLRALREKPELWKKYHTGENLLFTADDYRNPAGSEVFRELKQLKDRKTLYLVDIIEKAFSSRIRDVPSLIDIVEIDFAEKISPSRIGAGTDTIAAPASALGEVVALRLSQTGEVATADREGKYRDEKSEREKTAETLDNKEKKSKEKRWKVDEILTYITGLESPEDEIRAEAAEGIAKSLEEGDVDKNKLILILAERGSISLLERYINEENPGVRISSLKALNMIMKLDQKIYSPNPKRFIKSFVRYKDEPLPEYHSAAMECLEIIETRSEISLDLMDKILLYVRTVLKNANNELQIKALRIFRKIIFSPGEKGNRKWFEQKMIRYSAFVVAASLFTLFIVLIFVFLLSEVLRIRGMSGALIFFLFFSLFLTFFVILIILKGKKLYPWEIIRKDTEFLLDLMDYEEDVSPELKKEILKTIDANMKLYQSWAYFNSSDSTRRYIINLMATAAYGLEHPDKEIKELALNILTQFHSYFYDVLITPSTISALVKIVEHDEAELRRKAVTLLGRMLFLTFRKLALFPFMQIAGDYKIQILCDYAVPPLLRWVTDADEIVRATAWCYFTMTIREGNPAKLVPTILECIFGTDTSLALNAIFAIRAIMEEGGKKGLGGPEAEEMMISVLVEKISGAIPPPMSIEILKTFSVYAR
ncbi:MAG: HEAT repeat domain-containing protein, partial [Thermoplasmata archaeon]